MIDLSIDRSVRGLILGLVLAEGVSIEAAPSELRGHCDEVAHRAAANDRPQRRLEVRNLLRMGGFKPSGRSKPAQEYLLRTIGETGSLPAIYNAVDCLNAVSVESGLPISLISLERVEPPLVVRYGAQGENFVFNSAGQTIDLAGLICLCGQVSGVPAPAGSPVKDSLVAKVTTHDRRLLACIYAPAGEVTQTEAGDWASRLAEQFTRWCSASRVASWTVCSDA